MRSASPQPWQWHIHGPGQAGCAQPSSAPLPPDFGASSVPSALQGWHCPRGHSPLVPSQHRSCGRHSRRLLFPAAASLEPWAATPVSLLSHSSPSLWLIPADKGNCTSCMLAILPPLPLISIIFNNNSNNNNNSISNNNNFISHLDLLFFRISSYFIITVLKHRRIILRTYY